MLTQLYLWVNPDLNKKNQ